jgi:hypothetical protein
METKVNFSNSRLQIELDRPWNRARQEISLIVDKQLCTTTLTVERSNASWTLCFDNVGHQPSARRILLRWDTLNLHKKDRRGWFKATINSTYTTPYRISGHVSSVFAVLHVNKLFSAELKAHLVWQPWWPVSVPCHDSTFEKIVLSTKRRVIHTRCFRKKSNSQKKNILFHIKIVFGMEISLFENVCRFA